MITWTEFSQQQPALADAGRRQFYHFGIALAFLATVRPDGAPRVHPVCPVISEAGLPITVPVVGPLLGLHFAGEAAVDYDTAKKTNEKCYPAGPNRSPTRRCDRWSGPGS